VTQFAKPSPKSYSATWLKQQLKAINREFFSNRHISVRCRAGWQGLLHPDGYTPKSAPPPSMEAEVRRATAEQEKKAPPPDPPISKWGKLLADGQRDVDDWTIQQPENRTWEYQPYR